MAIINTNEKEDIQDLLGAGLSDLIFAANEVRKEFIGNKLDLCSILNAKCGRCSEDCKFCAQSSRHRAKIETYPLKEKGEIVHAARKAKDIGAQRFGIVTSGNRLTSKETDVLAEAISEITGKVGILACASLGAVERSQFKVLKAAGLSRYHHNIETSPDFYSQIVSTHSFRDRVKTIDIAKDLGFEVCSGGIIGMGESWEDRIEMARLLKKLAVDSVPINILVPIKGTALEYSKPISFEDIIRAICIFRILLKDKTIKIAAGRESALKGLQIKGFQAGANGMIIDGYLTIKGAALEEDYALIEKIRKEWTE